MQILEELLRRFETTPRTPSRVQDAAAPELTDAHVFLLFAVAFARRGRLAWAVVLRDRALAILAGTDEVHQSLAQVGIERIAQAARGEAPETPCSALVGRALNVLPGFSRYKVDRIRQAVRTLEQVEHIDPVFAYHGHDLEPRGTVWAPLREAIGRELQVSVGSLAERCRAGGDARELRLLLEAVCRLPADVAGRHLDAVLPHCSTAPLLEAAIVAASRFGMRDLLEALGREPGPAVRGRRRDVSTALDMDPERAPLHPCSLTGLQAARVWRPPRPRPRTTPG